MVKPKEIELPKALEPIKEVVQDIIEKAQPVAVESLAGTTYTETVVEEHTVTTRRPRSCWSILSKRVISPALARSKIP